MPLHFTNGLSTYSVPFEPRDDLIEWVERSPHLKPELAEPAEALLAKLRAVKDGDTVEIEPQDVDVIEEAFEHMGQLEAERDDLAPVLRLAYELRGRL